MYDVHIPLDRRQLAQATVDAGLALQRCDYVMTWNWSVINLSDWKSAAWGGRAARIQSGVSKVQWWLEAHGLRLPPNRLTSPYIVAIAQNAGPLPNSLTIWRSPVRLRRPVVRTARRSRRSGARPRSGPLGPERLGPAPPAGRVCGQPTDRLPSGRRGRPAAPGSGGRPIDDVRRPADVRGDDRPARSGGFQHGIREALASRRLDDDVDAGDGQRASSTDPASVTTEPRSRSAIRASRSPRSGPSPISTSRRSGCAARSRAGGVDEGLEALAGLVVRDAPHDDRVVGDAPRRPPAPSFSRVVDDRERRHSGSPRPGIDRHPRSRSPRPSPAGCRSRPGRPGAWRGPRRHAGTTACVA